jgi:hypothetical protein
VYGGVKSMITFLLIVLIVAVIFQREIKNLIAYGFFLLISLWLWDYAWWGKIIGGILIFGIFCDILKEPIESITNFIEKRINKNKERNNVDM